MTEEEIPIIGDSDSKEENDETSEWFLGLLLD